MYKALETRLENIERHTFDRDDFEWFIVRLKGHCKAFGAEITLNGGDTEYTANLCCGFTFRFTFRPHCVGSFMENFGNALYGAISEKDNAYYEKGVANKIKSQWKQIVAIYDSAEQDLMNLLEGCKG